MTQPSLTAAAALKRLAAYLNARKLSDSPQAQAQREAASAALYSLSAAEVMNLSEAADLSDIEYYPDLLVPAEQALKHRFEMDFVALASFGSDDLSALTEHLDTLMHEHPAAKALVLSGVAYRPVGLDKNGSLLIEAAYELAYNSPLPIPAILLAQVESYEAAGEALPLSAGQNLSLRDQLQILSLEDPAAPFSQAPLPGEIKEIYRALAEAADDRTLTPTALKAALRDVMVRTRVQ